MSYVPAEATWALIDIEGVGLLGPRTSFQLLYSFHSQLPCTPGYLGTVWTVASIWLNRSGSLGHSHPRGGC
jgi:hypothetical protein